VAFVGYHARHSLHFVRLAIIIILVSAWMDDNLRTPHAGGSKINCALILLGDHSAHRKPKLIYAVGFVTFSLVRTKYSDNLLYECLYIRIFNIKCRHFNLITSEVTSHNNRQFMYINPRKIFEVL